MARWQVELSGHPHDLEELPRLVTAPGLRVLESEGRGLLVPLEASLNFTQLLTEQLTGADLQS